MSTDKAHHCPAVRLVPDRGAPGGMYNIGDGTQLPHRELTGLLQDRKGHARRCCVDDSKPR